MKIKLLFFSLAIICSIMMLQAQLPADLSKIKSTQITDDQLAQFIQQAKSSGQGEEDILIALKERGLPDAELQTLSSRVSSIMGGGSKSDNALNSEITSASRKTPESKSPLKDKKETTVSKVFGAELFSGASPLFVPNLNIATPLNYRVGPGDELLLEVYGNNVFTQKLLVSREGMINVRYAGLLNANGTTIEALTNTVKTRLSKYIPSLSGGSSKLQITLGAVRSINVSVVGAVKKPGSVTLPSLATLFNALYATGGPLDNGSFRNIELIRGNKKILEADLYDYLLKGDQSFLQDNDLIRVPFAQHQVLLSGLCNRPGIYEFKPTDKVSNLLDFAGGFTAKAYRGRLTGTRNGILVKEIIDISADQFGQYSLNHGDSLHVDSLVDKYLNRVMVKGAIYKPGTYAWTNGLQLMDVIAKAAGLKEDAFLGRVNILRTYENLEKENISVDLRPIIKGTASFELKNDDQVTVYSAYELKDQFTVAINGEVRNPGSFPYADSLTLQQLILLAGGFTDRSVPASIEVARQKKQVDITKADLPTSEIMAVALVTDLSKVGADFYLQPNDIITVKTDPSKKPQIKVLINGQVLYPGAYVLETRQDRLSKVLNRAGGLLPVADQQGVKIIRTSLMQDTAQINLLIKKQTKKDTTLAETADIKTTTTEIAVNLAGALAKPGSNYDIILEDGDEIIIPQLKNVVAVTGEVLKPVNVQFTPGKRFNYYVSSAGGYSAKARKSKSFVVYSNGRSTKTGNFLGIFRNYPKVTPGSTVVVAAKPIRDGKFDAAKAGVLISALSALATTLVLLKGL
jgi:protein involved in polysaccharide export with SLBB domain